MSGTFAEFALPFGASTRAGTQVSYVCSNSNPTYVAKRGNPAQAAHSDRPRLPL